MRSRSIHPLLFQLAPESAFRFAPSFVVSLLVSWLVCTNSSFARPGTVSWSDGKKTAGDLTLTPGKQLKLFTSGQPVEIPLEECKNLRFTPEKENTEHGFYFPEAGQTAKKMTGDVYPTRYIHTAITLPDGKVIEGHLFTCVLYVQADDGTAQKAVLEAKQTGQDGQKVEDIPFITAIDFTDAAGGESTLDLSKENIPGAQTPIVVSKPDLAPVSLQAGASAQTWSLPAPDPAKLVLSVQAPDGFHVAWPAQEADPATVAAVQVGLKNMQDFYDTRTLLGTMIDDDEIYSLTMLSRKGAMYDTAAGVVPWSLVVLHWKFDPTNTKVNLVNRASMGMGRASNSGPPPPVLKSTSLLGDISAPQRRPCAHFHQPRSRNPHHAHPMTASRQAPTAALAEAARSLRLALVLHGLVRWAAISGGGLLALLLLDQLLHSPQALRLPLAVVLGGYILIDFYRRVWRPMRKPLSPARAARLLEMDRNIVGNLLINAHQFEREQHDARTAPFVHSILGSSRNVLGNIPTASLWNTAPLRKWFWSLIAIAVCWALVVFAFPRYVATGMERIFLPMADVPPVGTWNIAVTPGFTVKLVEGDRLDVSATLTSQLGVKDAKPPLPQIVWQNESAATESSMGEHAAMVATDKPNTFVFSFTSVGQPFRFHVATDDSRSSSVDVDVSPLPQLKGSTFTITPPAYTGIKPSIQPGPPETLTVPAGSEVIAHVELVPQSPAVLWRTDKATTNLSADGAGWKLEQTVTDSAAYDLLTALPGSRDPRVLGRGQVTATPDRPPEVDFITDNRNVAANPGATIPVTIKTSDDYGVASLTLRLAPGDDASNVKVLKTWSYMGPPGQTTPAPEKFTVQLDPTMFVPGATFLLTAQATDFSPNGQKSTSRPIVIRVAGVNDMSVPTGDPLEKLFELLRNAITAQTKANGQTDNFKLHMDEAIQANDLKQHFAAMHDTQQDTQALALTALEEADKQPQGKVYHSRLEPVARGEMDLAMGQIAALSKITSSDVLAPALDAIQKRQIYILNELVTLLGQMASDRQQSATDALNKKPDAKPPLVTTNEEMAKLKDELKAFTNEQKRIIDATKAFHSNPDDLTNAEQEALGKLARDEAKQAKFFQERLTDLSKLALQDFGDGKVVSDTNEVYQEVQKASKDLYAKRTEIAVPGETQALEAAKSIEQNLERWLPNTPDNTKWSMEEPANQPADVPLAELPKQLDDLVGDLLHKEQEMDPDKDDPSSSIMDSMDKGAGWGASDGPMSNMSAKGVTGNQLPNNNEINGRSGEGRNGKSDGEMVGNTAVGKGGNETPTRMTSTPYENGSVADQSKGTKGGATGGGKLAGFGEEGLRGNAPPSAKQRVKMLATQQAQIRQQAESLALQLRKQRRPTGDLETAVAAMQKFENSANSADGLGVVQGYHQALDALSAARTSYSGERLSRVEADQLGRATEQNVNDTQAEQAPAGYEEMTGAYFRSLSDSGAPPAADSGAGTPAPAASSSNAMSTSPASASSPSASAAPATQ